MSKTGVPFAGTEFGDDEGRRMFDPDRCFAIREEAEADAAVTRHLPKLVPECVKKFHRSTFGRMVESALAALLVAGAAWFPFQVYLAWRNGGAVW